MKLSNCAAGQHMPDRGGCQCCRKIPISLIDPDFGEQRAQTCVIACSDSHLFLKSSGCHLSCINCVFGGRDLHFRTCAHTPPVWHSVKPRTMERHSPNLRFHVGQNLNSDWDASKRLIVRRSAEPNLPKPSLGEGKVNEETNQRPAQRFRA